MEVTWVAISSGSQNGSTCVSLSLHPLAAFLGATLLAHCLIHAHRFLLYIRELIWLMGINLSNHLPLTVQIQPTARSKKKHR